MLGEFREFLFRGNVVGLSVAVIIGAAFGAVVKSFTEDILTPLLGLVGVPDFSNLAFITPGGAAIAYGLFLNALIFFVLVAAVIFFLVIKPMNAVEARIKKAEAAQPTTKTCTECATDIPLAAKRCPNCIQPQA